MFPNFFACRRIECEQVRINRPVRSPAAMYRLIALKDLDEKFFLVDRRARAVGPLKSELAVILLKIAGPKLFAGEIKSRQISVAIIEDHNFPIRHRRPRSAIALL